jgi:hypothetical protein
MSRRNGGIIGPTNTPVGGFVAGVAGGVWRMNDVLTFVSNSQWPKTPENIENALRFDDDSNDYLNATLGTGGNSKTFTVSFWFKLGLIPSGNSMNTIGTGVDNTNDFMIGFSYDSSRTTGIHILARNGSSTRVIDVQTNKKFRDLSAWYHAVIAIDTTQSTSSDRVKIYINGSQETSLLTSTYPDQDTELRWNSANIHYVGTTRDNQTSATYDGYFAEVVNVDGLALTPSSFGETNTASGIWTPKKIGQIANAGTNSFYLNFKDSSNVGKDQSGNGHNFTVNNLTSIDQSTDTCVENFATLNPNHRGTHLTDASFSEGNLKHQGTSSGGNYPYSFSTIAASQGKWYAEFKVASDPSTTMIGIASGIADSFLGGTGSAKGYALYGNSGNLFESGSGSSYGSALSVGDILGVAMDLDNNKLYFSKNGTFHNSGDPTSGSTGTGAVSITAAADNGPGVYHFACGKAGTATTSIQANFGAPPFTISSGNSDANGFGNFEYAVPSGYYALNTSNLNTYG